MGYLPTPESDKEWAVRMGYLRRCNKHPKEGPIYFDRYLECPHPECMKERRNDCQRRKEERERRSSSQSQNPKVSDAPQQDSLRKSVVTPQSESELSVSEWVKVKIKCPEHGEFLYWNRITWLYKCTTPGCSLHSDRCGPSEDKKPTPRAVDETYSTSEAKKPGIVDKWTKFIKGLR